MEKIILIAVAAVVLLGGGIGGVFAYLSLQHHAKPVAKVVPPKPIYFAQLGDIVVTVPADTSDPTTTYVQITLQFSSFDTNAITSFDNLQPIIKSGGLFAEGGEALIWITDDDRRIMVQLKARMPVLRSLDLFLKSYTPPTNPPG